MYRLNKKALAILRAEVVRCGNGDVHTNKREQVLKRFDQLSLDVGKCATIDELRKQVVDVFPIFSEQVLKQAAKVNQKPGLLSKLKWVFVGLAGASGILWVVNLPIPAIRWSVAKNAPMLLLPSYKLMENSYSEAIAELGKAEEILQDATDIVQVQVAVVKIQAAEESLQAIPAWFVGYYPEGYCNKIDCAQKISFKDFESLHSRINLFSVKALQEKNTYELFNEATQAFSTAKLKYQQSANMQQKQDATAIMEQSVVTLNKIPPQTLAYRATEKEILDIKADYELLRVTLAKNQP